MWFRRRKQPEPPKPHRGRIYRAGAWWRYKCYDCDFGAGSVGPGAAVVPIYLETATRHAQARR